MTAVGTSKVYNHSHEFIRGCSGSEREKNVTKLYTQTDGKSYKTRTTDIGSRPTPPPPPSNSPYLSFSLSEKNVFISKWLQNINVEWHSLDKPWEMISFHTLFSILSTKHSVCSLDWPVLWTPVQFRLRLSGRKCWWASTAHQCNSQGHPQGNFTPKSYPLNQKTFF